MDTELVELIDKVLVQLVNDVKDGDLTAIEEMLAFVPKDKLLGFLPENDPLVDKDIDLAV